MVDNPEKSPRRGAGGNTRHIPSVVTHNSKSAPRAIQAPGRDATLYVKEPEEI